jgi:hypothetical protein
MITSKLSFPNTIYIINILNIEKLGNENMRWKKQANVLGKGKSPIPLQRRFLVPVPLHVNTLMHGDQASFFRTNALLLDQVIFFL